jgi:hypothetical protein
LPAGFFGEGSRDKGGGATLGELLLLLLLPSHILLTFTPLLAATAA